jgi:hypothetical protein
MNDMTTRTGEITLKDIIVKLGNAGRYLLRRWRVILLGVLLGGALGFCISFFKKTQYVGTLSFVLEDTKTGALGAYSGLAAQFGLDMGGMGGNGVFTGDNILEFLRSRLMVERALLTDTTWQGQKLTLADLYIVAYRWREKWSGKGPELANISFPVGSQPGTLTRLQDSVMTLLHTIILEKHLVVDKPDKKLSFIDASTTSTNDFFSKLFTERLVKAATDFYVKTKTQRQQQNVDKLQTQADSILSLLDKTTYAAARNQDLNLNPARKVATVGIELASRDKTILGTMYTEVAKNLELAKISLLEQTPVIQVVDAPVFPVERVKNSLAKAVAIGLFLGGFLTVLFVVAVKAFRVIMQ